MNNFNFSYFTRLFCCHPSQFETSELLCSSLISKYISHRQNAQQYFPASSNIELGSTYYPSRPTNSAPYYYGDLIYQQQQRQQSNLSSNQEASRVYAIMDGLRVQLKNPGRNNQSLRSPCVHRSDEFTVSLRGWLYRLEGAALKQWKRRWCVLADYCLFYYKDMAEEKLLGSLLLPSYRISPCFSRDGISRKFAFKAEHSNMKTYYFAADSKEMQQQWMNALSLASIMQLNIMCPTKTSKPTNNANFNSPNHHVDNIQHLNNNSQFLESKNSPKVTKDLTEDESGFLEYQAKRLEDNSAIMYGSDYYNSNFTGESLNLFNSVGLPSVFSDQMLPYNNYASAPPKPQRQYYAPTMSYDMPSSSLIDYNSPDLINANPNYYTDNYGPYYPDNNFSSSYPEYIEDSEFQHYPSNYYQRLPPRPHSADFLERNQDDDFDEECQNAFQKDDKNLFITNANLAPKILPSRPKSSIARYDPMLKSQNNKHSRTGFYNNSKPFDKKDFLSKLDNGLYDKPLTAYPNANHNLSQYFVYSNNGNYNYLLKNSTKEENEMNSQILSNYCKSENISNHSVPVRPPLPHEYASKFGTQNTDLDSNLSRSISSSCKILAKSDSTGKETSYTSDDESERKSSEKENFDGSVHKSKRDDLIEISKEEYYKASQMFFKNGRQKYLPVTALNNSSSDISDTGMRPNSIEASVRTGDWNDIGLPMPSSNSLQGPHISSNKPKDQSIFLDALRKSITAADTNLANEQDFELGMFKTDSNSSIHSASLNSIEQEVRFKLGVKVRTYKKPRSDLTNGDKSSEMASDNSSNEFTSSIEAINKAKTICNEKPRKRFDNEVNLNVSNFAKNGEAVDAKDGGTKSTSTAAPYYYSDLLTEEQKIALQKKLGNFASPPPLLSRCTAINNARYLGMTSLTSKPKSGSINVEKHVTGNNANDCNGSNSSLPKVDSIENEENELREKCQNGIGTNGSLVDPTNQELNAKLVNGHCSLQLNELIRSEPHIYENYDTPQNIALFLDSDSDRALLSGTLTSFTYSDEKKTNFLKSFDGHFCSQNELNTSDCLDSLHEFNLKNSRKRKVKRKSKEDFNNVSDSEIHRKENRKTRSFKYSKRLCFSAADYVGKSNEELILMLIKLRRRQSDLSKSCDKLRLQMESEAKMMEIEPHRKEEYNFRFKELKQKLAKVEKEYEFRLPVIDTIDNMIKVKSNSRNNKAASTSLLDEVTSLDSRLNAVINLSEKIPDGFDKELDTNTTKMISSADNVETSNENIENLKKQQKVLANELDRVRGLLTHSTKKLEEKAVENAQMEHEMLIARNKLKQVLETEQEAMEITRSSKLESELAHINDVIDNLHSRRKELNTAIENLKNSDTKCTDSFIRPDISFIDDMVSLPDINRITLEQIDNRENDTSYQEVLLSSEEVPLYENITSARRFVDDNSLPSRSISMFDQVNNNLDNPENDEFFTLNINLNKTKQYSSKYGQEKNSTLEINNNDSKHNMNTMCEFDPTKDIHIAYGDSIVDQQIKQIYNYQPGGQKASEIKTVREVKRESERRKYHQQQNYKLSQFSRNDRAISNCGSYYLLSNHFYNENDSLAMHMPVTTSFIPENVSEFDDVLHIYNANALVTNPIQTKMTSLTEMTNDEINRNNFTTPDIVQSTIKLSDDFYDRED